MSGKKKSRNDSETENVNEENPALRSIVQKHWSSIKTFIRIGKSKTYAIFFYNCGFREMIHNVSELTMNNVKSHFKVNYSLGYVLRNIESKILRYYYASSNNLVVLDTARLVSNRQDLIKFLNNIAEKNSENMLSQGG